MKLKLYYTFFNTLILLSTIIQCYGQSPDFLWAKSMGGTDQDFGIALATDKAGNVFSIGNFSGTADFDPGPGIYNLTAAGVTDIFISKLDATGNFVWAKRIGGSDDDHGNSIAVDSAGNVYTTGWVFGTVDFDPGLNVYNLTVAGYTQFISKLDSAGNFTWAKVIGGTNSTSTQGESITIGASGDAYTTGIFLGNVDFDPDSISTFYLSSPSNGSFFISKINSSGHFVWAKSFTGTSANAGFFITSDADENLYTTGYFYGIEDFDPGPGTNNLTSAGGGDFFVLKTDSSGNLVWAKNMGGASNEYGMSLTVGSSGEIYTTGYFSGTADFNPDFGVFNLTSAGLNDIFISKLDSSGNFIWARQLGGVGNDYGQSITIDNNQNIYTTGTFSDTADFDPGLASNYNLISQGDRDVFISRLNKSGNFEFAEAMGGTGEDFGQALVHNTTGFVYITGAFNSPSVIFNPILINNVSGNAGLYDIYTAKLDTLTITAISENANHKPKINIYPNPSSGLLTIEFSTFMTKANISIYDMMGNNIHEITISDQQKIEINTGMFSDGIYVIRIKTPQFSQIIKLILSK